MSFWERLHRGMGQKLLGWWITHSREMLQELVQQSLNFVARNKCLLKMHDHDTLIEQSL